MKAEPIQEHAGSAVTVSREPSDAEIAGIFELLKERGFVLVRGLPADVKGFETFTGRFPLQFIPHQGLDLGYRSPVQGADRTIATVNAGMGPAGWHFERGYVPLYPDVIFFHCVKESKVAGETMVTDGAALRHAFEGEFRQTCERIILQFSESVRRAEAPNQYNAFLSAVGAQSAAQARAIYEHLIPPLRSPGDAFELTLTEEEAGYKYSYPLIRRARWTGEEVLCAYLEFGALKQPDGTVLPRELVEAISDAAYAKAYFHKWTPGDVIIVNNCRMMHARAAFNDPERKVLVRMGLAQRAA